MTILKVKNVGTAEQIWCLHSLLILRKTTDTSKNHLLKIAANLHVSYFSTFFALIGERAKSCCKCSLLLSNEIRMCQNKQRLSIQQTGGVKQIQRSYNFVVNAGKEKSKRKEKGTKTSNIHNHAKLWKQNDSMGIEEYRWLVKFSPRYKLHFTSHLIGIV